MVSCSGRAGDNLWLDDASCVQVCHVCIVANCQVRARGSVLQSKEASWFREGRHDGRRNQAQNTARREENWRAGQGARTMVYLAAPRLRFGQAFGAGCFTDRIYRPQVRCTCFFCRKTVLSAGSCLGSRLRKYQDSHPQATSALQGRGRLETGDRADVGSSFFARNNLITVQDSDDSSQRPRRPRSWVALLKDWHVLTNIPVSQHFHVQAIQGCSVMISRLRMARISDRS